MKKSLIITIFIALTFYLTSKVSFAATEVIRTIKPSGQGGDYTTLAAWEAGEQRDLVAADEIAVAQIDGNWTTPDTTAVTINGWTTDATRYIKIYTTEQARHSGKWDNARYEMNPSSGRAILNYESYVRIEGIQFTQANNDTVRISVDATPSEVTIRNNLFKSSGMNYLSAIALTPAVISETKIFNNIIYDGVGTENAGITINGVGATAYVYNNTLVNNTWGIRVVNGSAIAKNNIVKGSGNTNAYLGTFFSGTDYNATDGTDAIGQGSNNKISQTFSFVNEAQKDFHLASNDLGTRDSGANLFSDANLPITDDIDGQARLSTNSYDIGADEVMGATRVVFAPDPGQETNFGAATAIYRSVGPGNTTALAVGTSNTLTITGSTATFSSPLPDRIGVGDALQYDDDNDSDIDVNDSIVFIHARINSKTYTVKTASGGSPTSIASDNNWSIFRAYTSLSLAEAGTENTGIDADLRAFDTFSGGKDIATSNEVWNIAAYGDAPDTTAVTINGWTTGASNYIRIYTPVSKEEVGVSQRHRGKWDDGKYRLSTSNSSALDIRDDYITVNGLQIEVATSNGNSQNPISLIGAFTNFSNKINIFNSILKGHNNATYVENLIYANTANLNLDVWSVVAYNLNTSNNNSIGIYLNQSTASINIYSSTFIGGYRGFSRISGAVTCKNMYAGGSGATDYNGIDKTTCASSDTTGSIGLQNIAANNANFMNVSIGSEDYHIKPNSALKDVGTNTSVDLAPLNFTTDIDGQNKVGLWDIGADERPANTVIRGGVKITK